MERISMLRSKLEQLDLRMLNLIKRRLELAQQIGMLKLRYNLPLRDRNREAQLLANISERCAQLELNPQEIRRIFRILIRLSLEHQLKLAKSGAPSDRKQPRSHP